MNQQASSFSSFAVYPEDFRSCLFHERLMRERLSKKAYLHFLSIKEGKVPLDHNHLEEYAAELKKWALEEGATEYTHWFQPLTSSSAEKHDSFLQIGEGGHPLASLEGKDLLRGEPDASSFPSGGLRATHQARGYTLWDLASPPFLWESAAGKTLCIPSVYFSWTGASLDQKIPLLRSQEKLARVACRLLRLCSLSANRVVSTLGIEQEYFLIDRTWLKQRPDLQIAGRTVYGMQPAKGQELEDHYLGLLPEKTLSFMRDFEAEALRLGIPMKTRHGEVAPCQYEVAPLFEEASLAIDHNLLLMQLMRKVASRHGLSCLFHEKPFAHLNGSGKHNNWSLITDTGINLLDPHKSPHLVFLLVMTAILRAVHQNALLLRASIGSAGNDLRLGGHEAPPAILSIDLGEALTEFLQGIIEEREGKKVSLKKVDLGLSHIPDHEVDPSDRNRTSFFAFTGNKFEFRAVGASAHCAFPITVIQAIVADSLELLLDEIESAKPEKSLSEEELFVFCLPILKKHLKEAWPVVFSGNAYTQEWIEEAQKRGLPNIGKSFHSYQALLKPETKRLFHQILSEEELQARFETLVERYAKTVGIEVQLMVELFRSYILPAAQRDQKRRALSLNGLQQLQIVPDARQLAHLKKFSQLIGEGIEAVEELVRQKQQTEGLGWEAKGAACSELIVSQMEKTRAQVDWLEEWVDHTLWPLAKYREMLF